MRNSHWFVARSRRQMGSANSKMIENSKDFTTWKDCDHDGRDGDAEDVRLSWESEEYIDKEPHY
jgi:hypothetical protein